MLPLAEKLHFGNISRPGEKRPWKPCEFESRLVTAHLVPQHLNSTASGGDGPIGVFDQDEVDLFNYHQQGKAQRRDSVHEELSQTDGFGDQTVSEERAAAARWSLMARSRLPFLVIRKGVGMSYKDARERRLG